MTNPISSDRSILAGQDKTVRPQGGKTRQDLNAEPKETRSGQVSDDQLSLRQASQTLAGDRVTGNGGQLAPDSARSLLETIKMQLQATPEMAFKALTGNLNADLSGLLETAPSN